MMKKCDETQNVTSWMKSLLVSFCMISYLGSTRNASDSLDKPRHLETVSDLQDSSEKLKRDSPGVRLIE